MNIEMRHLSPYEVTEDITPPFPSLIAFTVSTKTETITQWSKRYLFPFFEEELVGKSLSDIFSPVFLSFWLKPTLQRIQRNVLEECCFSEIFLKISSGFYGVGMIVLDNDTFLLYIRDFSAWQATYQHEKKLFATDQKAVFIINEDGRINNVNHGFSRITGYENSEIEGSFHNLFSPEKQDSAHCKEILASLNKYGSWKGYVWDKRKNGETYQQYLSLEKLGCSAKTGPLYAGIFCDITRSREGYAGRSRKDLFDQRSFLHILSGMLRRGKSFNGSDMTHLAILHIKLHGVKKFDYLYDHDDNPDNFTLLSMIHQLEESLTISDFIATSVGGNILILGISNIHKTEQIIPLAQKIKETLEHPNVFPREMEIQNPISIGISCFPRDGHTPEKLLDHAEIAAEWKDKEEQRIEPTFFSPDMILSRRNKASLERGLQRAVKEDEFFLLYQPKIDLKTKALIGVEALLRWKFKSQGKIVLPGEFIPLAEQSGAIVSIGKWVLREALTAMKAWKRAYARDFHVSVNISALQLAQPSLEEYLDTLLEESNVAPDNLVLELTENTVIGMDHKTLSLLGRLRSLGMGISIDDFGTGYSSLGYLQNLPVSELKIDKTFMTSLHKDSRSQALLKSIVSLGASLGLNVVVEGVETVPQESILSSFCMPLGVQGFLYAPPMKQELFQRQFLEAKTRGNDLLTK